MVPARTIAYVRTDVIRSNLESLAAVAEASHAEFHGVVPMVKANAYGHGLEEAGRAASRSKATLALGVAAVEEGVSLRRAGVRKPIWVFSDCAPWTEERVSACMRHGLSPVLHRFEDLAAILKAGSPFRSRGGFHVKFNTGMNRLGIDMADVARVARLLRASAVRGVGVCTHFAMAEEASERLSRFQAARFREVVGALAGHSISYIHGANTAAILNGKALGLGGYCNVVRPGIGIYGYAGRAGERIGLRPALTWVARVVEARRLGRGERVGYGGTYRARGGERQAVLAVGYGDGLSRAVSNKEIMVGRGGRGGVGILGPRGASLRRARVLGLVSMDLTSIEFPARVGEYVCLLGASFSQGELLAGAAASITYESLTSISARVPRIYL